MIEIVVDTLQLSFFVDSMVSKGLNTRLQIRKEGKCYETKLKAEA